MYDDKLLCRYLRELPSAKNFLYTDEVRRGLLRMLFKSISANGKYLSYFFPHGPPLPTAEWKMATGESDPSHPGRPCMHQFQKGEPTYKCKECGLDDTCVLCYRCYNASDHVGHSVTVSISQKDGGGVCDCGDPEAWLRDVNCQYYSASSLPPQPLPDDLLECIRGTVARSLDYILDIFSCSPQSYQDCRFEEMIMQDFNSFALDTNVYGGVPGEADKDNGQFALILWNDEKHSFTDVIQIVARATRRREEYGRFISEEVDTVGRKIVSTSRRLHDLINAREVIDSIQLAASIRSTRDTFREDMCGTILQFLCDLSASSLVGHHFILRDIICEALCQPWRVGSSATRIRQQLYQLSGHFEDPDDELSISTGTIGAISTSGDEIPSVSNMTDADNAAAQNVAAPAYWLNESASLSASPHSKDERRLRLDYLMLFDLRFWKQARNAIKDLLMCTMISNLDYKHTMGMHFAELYPELVEQYMLADREPDCSMMILSTQLFTCPTIATEIVKKHFTSFLAIIYTYLTKGRVGPPSSVDLTASIVSDRRTLKNRRLQQVFVHLDHIISRNVIKQRVSCDEDHIRQIADIFLLFEGCAPFIRQINEHVEYESTEWVSFFQFIAPIVKLGKSVAEGCWQGPRASTHRSIRNVARLATSWSLGFMRDRFPNSEIMDEPHFHPVTAVGTSMVTYPVVLFPVEFYVLSIHHPLHGFLTRLIEFGQVESAQQLRSLLSFSAQDPPSPGHAVIYGPEDMLMILLDYPLRTLVLVAQVRVGLWVRNGYTLRTHEVHYRDMSMRDSGYARDIFGVQIMMATCTPSRVMLTLFERWSLISWLCGSVEHPSFDEGKLLYVVEEFLHGMIVLLSERKRLIGNDYETTKRALIEREIIQVMCFGPIAFSDLVRKMPEYLSADEKFEPILRAITNYKPPEGLNDFGTYELKDEFSDKVDPYFFHYTATQWDSAEVALRKALSKKSGLPVEKVVIEPKLEPITTGPFTRLGWVVGTVEFAQMVYVTLCNIAFMRLPASSSLPESLMALTLYLCHIAVIEDRICAPDQDRGLPTFSYNACTVASYKVGPTDGENQTILEVLMYIRDSASFTAYKATVERIIELIKENEPDAFATEVSNQAVHESVPVADVSMADDDGETAAERKKRQAKERQARILAEFQKQQQSFAEKNKGSIDDDADDDEDEAMVDDDDDESESAWKYPCGACILCRKPATDAEIFGTIGLATESTLFRQTPFESEEWMKDALCVCPDLDRPVALADYDPSENVTENDSSIGTGFPNSAVRREPVAVSCGHIMHLSCYEDYKDAIKSRQRQHITRNPPEDIEKGEFLCPLCKSLNNMFLPLIFKPIEKSLDSVLNTKVPFSEWIVDDVWNSITQMKMCTESGATEATPLFNEFARKNIENAVETTLSPFYLRQFKSTTTSGWLNARLLGALTGTYEERRVISTELDAIQKVYMSNARSLVSLTRADGSSPISQDMSSLQRMVKVYGASISSAEIALRGANRTESGNDIGATVLDQISQRTLSLLRILRASSLTAGSFGVVDGVEKLTGISPPYRKAVYQQIGKLFFGQECMYDKTIVSCPNIVSPLLTEDIFGFLAESSVCMVPAMDCELHNVMMLCYIAQVVKVLYILGDQICRQHAWLKVPEIQRLGENVKIGNNSLDQVKEFAKSILLQSGYHYFSAVDTFSLIPGNTFYALVNRFTLPFLRKCAILAYVEGAISYDGAKVLEATAEDTETARLLTLLKLPAINDMVSALCSGQNKTLSEVISRWCRHLDLTIRRPQSMQVMKTSLEFPGPLQLLKLPRRLHGFFQEVGKMKCAKCGKVPEDPGVCLFCGVLVCCQDYCCVNEWGVGECNQHMKECAGYVGIFLLITKCTILFLKDKQGSFVVAPYLDVHGEVDPNLKRGRPLYLSQKRYDNLIRNVWLQNGIASQVARRIEGSLDNGGWEGM